MYEVKKSEEVLYKGWDQDDAVATLEHNEGAVMTVVDDTAPEAEPEAFAFGALLPEEPPISREDLEELVALGREKLTTIFSSAGDSFEDAMNKVGLTPEQREKLKRELEANATKVAEQFSSALKQGQFHIGNAFVRLGKFLQTAPAVEDKPSGHVCHGDGCCSE